MNCNCSLKYYSTILWTLITNSILLLACCYICFIYYMSLFQETRLLGSHLGSHNRKEENKKKTKQNFKLQKWLSFAGIYNNLQGIFTEPLKGNVIKKKRKKMFLMCMGNFLMNPRNFLAGLPGCAVDHPNMIVISLNMTVNLGLHYKDIVALLANCQGCILSERHIKWILKLHGPFRCKGYTSLDLVVNFTHEQLQTSGQLCGFGWVYTKCQENGLHIKKEEVRLSLSSLTQE